MSYPSGNLFIQGPAGQLECILRMSAGDAPWAIVSHPHPIHGGTMHNKVVYRIAQALQREGFHVIRFNFRGVGNSGGSYDEGRGEAHDLRAVMDHVERENSRKGILLAGFSFGSWINARVGCSDPRVSGLLHVGLAASFLDIDFLWSCTKPTAVVQGDRDQFGEWSRVTYVVSSMQSATLYRVVEADHFFEGKLEELQAALRKAILDLK